MRRDRSVVTAQTVTRYFVFGRGYNSSLAAHMQLAKWYVAKLGRAALSAELARKGSMSSHEWGEFEAQWYATRYPAREGCRCHYCSSRTFAAIPKGRGCWLAKMADYRQIAREIMAGERNNDGTPVSANRAIPPSLPEASVA